MDMNARYRRYLIQIGLPLLFVAPEVINLGVMFLRWDYLLFLYLLMSFMLSPARLRSQSDLLWTQRTTFLVLIYFLTSILFILRLSGGSEGLDGVKYASWPIKTIMWAVGAWFSLRLLGANERTIYKTLTVLVLLVLVMQTLEFVSPAFREWGFIYYPVGAEERLRELDFRARGPFNGFDATSVFFLAAGVYFNEFTRRFAVGGFDAAWRLFATITGAYLSARTGFLLLILYLLVTRFARGKLLSKVVWIAAGLLAVVFLPNWAGTVSGQDDSLLGRNLEVIQALLSGDLMETQSFAGTFAMNRSLLSVGFDSFWGEGLIVSTTADQLYFKYLFMFGQVGLLVWLVIHMLLFWLCYRKTPVTRAQQTYRSTALAVIVLVAVAHIKGGNYFFASRLGEIIALQIFLATLGVRRYRNSDQDAL